MTYAFTYDQVVKMFERNVLPETLRVELLDGALVEMTPQGPLHCSEADHIAALLRTLYPNLLVREDKPLQIHAVTVPEPDISIVRGTPADYTLELPTGMDSVLVVEIAITSLKRDREKASYYARGAVPVYWVVDVPKRVLEVYTEPNTLSKRYITSAKYRQDEHVDLPELDRKLLVRDLFLV
jgi:Uma2 family endonuclease